MSDFDCKIVEEVQKYRNLYESSLREHKDIARATNSGKETVGTLEVDVDICKKRWKCIRVIRANKKKNERRKEWRGPH